MSQNEVARFRTVDGVSVPAFFYGTAWKEDRTRDLTALALAAGFRAIDTANQRRHYVEAAVGEALTPPAPAPAPPPRAEVFLQTKFTYARGQDHRLPYDAAADPATQVRQSFESSLQHLSTTYVDSYVLHGPSAAQDILPIDLEVWRTMETFRATGKARLLGISNVSLPQLVTLVEREGIRPAFVQNRCFARTGWDADLRAFCRRHDIVYQAFSLLTANRQELASPAVASIVRRTGRTLPQVVFRFALQAGMIPLTGTSSPVHMAEDLASFDFELSPEDHGTISGLAAP